MPLYLTHTIPQPDSGPNAAIRPECLEALKSRQKQEVGCENPPTWSLPPREQAMGLSRDTEQTEPRGSVHFS